MDGLLEIVVEKGGGQVLNTETKKKKKRHLLGRTTLFDNDAGHDSQNSVVYGCVYIIVVPRI